MSWVQWLLAVYVVGTLLSTVTCAWQWKLRGVETQYEWVGALALSTAFWWFVLPLSLRFIAFHYLRKAPTS